MLSVSNLVILSLKYESDLDAFYSKGNDKIKVAYFFIILLFPLFPFLSPFNRVNLKLSNNKDELYFKTTKIPPKQGDCCIIELNKKNKTHFVKCSIKGYILYIFSLLKMIGNRKDFNVVSFLKLAELCLVAEKIEKFKFKSIEITNHYDRWAYFFSHYCEKNNASLIVHQHGLVTNDVWNEEKFWHPKEKLPSVEFLYCYNVESENFFKRYIYEKIANVVYFSNEINLVVSNLKGHKIFIIGSSLKDTISREIDLIEKINCNLNGVVFFIKPHPVAQFNYRKMENIHIVDDVILSDIYVHFGSTVMFDIRRINNELKDIDLSRVNNEGAYNIIEENFND